MCTQQSIAYAPKRLLEIHILSGYVLLPELLRYIYIYLPYTCGGLIVSPITVVCENRLDKVVDKAP